MRLSDGTVIPSYLSVRSGAGQSGYERATTDMIPRVGRVVAAYPPTHSGNTNKKFWEYDVKVDLVTNGTYSEIIYPRCQLASMFGGIADYFRWKPRIGGLINETGKTLYSGSRVIILCMNGSTKNAIVIGGQNHPGSGVDPGVEAGLHMVGEFNGINISISDEGDLNIVHRGKTDAAGKVLDGDITKTGSSISMNQNGDILIGTGEENGQLLQLDSQNKAARLISNGEIDIGADDNVLIKSAGVLTGDATDATMLGTTYRKAQTDLHNELIAGLSKMMEGLRSAATSILALSPGTSVGLTQCANAASSMLLSLHFFEEGVYLSDKNFSD